MGFFVDWSLFLRRTVGLFDNLKYLSGRRLPDMCVCEVDIKGGKRNSRLKQHV